MHHGVLELLIAELELKNDILRKMRRGGRGLEAAYRHSVVSSGSKVNNLAASTRRNHDLESNEVVFVNDTVNITTSHQITHLSQRK